MPPEWIHSNNERSIQPETILPCSQTENFLQHLKANIGPARYQKWFAERTTITIAGDLLTVGLGSPFLIKWMIREFQQPATEAARKCLGLSAQVRFDVDPRAGNLLHEAPTSSPVGSYLEALPSQHLPARNEVAETTAPALRVQWPEEGTPAAPSRHSHEVRNRNREEESPSRQKLPPRRRRFARLDDFVVGPTNHVALSMARIVAEQPGEQYNPLYFYGNVGIGKTHLLEGIHSETRQKFPELTVTYLTAEAFANYYTKALREKTLPAFRRRFRSIDVLLVDDIEFLDAKKGIQEEFCHTLQELLSYGRQIVLAADRHPRMLTNIRPDLCTRFLSGLVTRLETPDEQTRKAILRQQIQKIALPVSEDALEYVARKFTRNVRELLGAVNCLQTHFHMTKRPIGITATREILRDLERDCLRIVRAADIQQAVCELFGVPQQDLISSKRNRQLAQPRMLAMYLTRQWTQSAYHEIGKQFGGRNHSTVMSAERKMKEMLKRNEAIQISMREWKAQELVAILEEQLQVG